MTIVCSESVLLIKDLTWQKLPACEDGGIYKKDLSMKCTSRFKFVILFCAFAFIPQNAFAFMSPSTLTLVAAAMNSSILAILTFAGVNLLLFLRKINRTTKAVFLIMAVSALISAGFIFAHRVNAIEKLNDIYRDVPLLEHEVDLNRLSMGELSKFKIITIDTTDRILDDEARKNIKLSNDMLDLIFSNFSEFEKKVDLQFYKDKKLLAVCEGGNAASEIVRVLRTKGYNAFLARLERTYNSELLNKYFIFKKKKPASSLIVVPYGGQENKLFFYFDYSKPPAELRANEIIEPRQFEKKMAEGKNIVCSDNFSCLMTKYFLDSHGIKNRKIYQL